MKLKSTWIKILSLSLSLVLLFSCIIFAEDIAQAENANLLETFMEYDTIPQLFDAAEDALQEGADPAKVKDALYTAADQKDMYPYFSYAIENYVSMGGKGYNKLMNHLSPEESSDRALNCDKTSSRSYVSRISFDAYSTSQASSRFISMIGDKSAQCSVPSYFLSEADFKALYKKSLAKFNPSRSRPGYICVVVTDKTQSSPNTLWSKDNTSSFRQTLRNIVEAFFSKASDAGSSPVITGNPNVASHFLVVELTYPLRGEYNLDNGKRIKGYNCKLTVRLENAKTHKKLATYSQTKTLGDRITVSVWATNARADMPDYKSNSSFTSLAKAAVKEFKNQDSKIAASRPLTESNAKAVLDGILQAQAKGAGVWETAIYESSAEEIALSGSSEVSFSLRSYDPKLKKLGSYNKAKDRDEWLNTALLRISKHNLKITLKLSNGVPTKQSLSELKATVEKAAKTARKAFVSSDMTAALKDRFFPAPLKGKASKYTKLFQPTNSFSDFYDKYLSDNSHLSLSLFSMICYAQKSLSVNVKKGPHNLLLTFTGIAKPASFVKSSANKVVKTMAYLPLKSRPSDEEPEYTLLKRIARSALSSHTDAKSTFTLTVDVDQLSSDTLPSSYISYLNGFDISDAVDSMSDRINSLPKIAAVEMPGTKILSGGKGGGGKITISVSSKGSPTYIQFRKKDTKEKVATMFIHPGKEITFRLPNGDYYFVYCTGTYWYGEKNRFMEPNNIYKSGSFDMKKNYIRTFELNVSNGNSKVYQGSNKDLD